MIGARTGRWLGGLAAALLASVACSSVQQHDIGIQAPDSSEAGFGPVGDYLDHRCGTHDCHGQAGRNLRIWGCNGMRIDPYDPPSCNRMTGGSDTTPHEHLATYRSLVGLEPSVMSAVVASRGEYADLLTFVRKARGTETHKGGALITPGDDQDKCITSWLSGGTDVLACSNALGYPIFSAPDASAE